MPRPPEEPQEMRVPVVPMKEMLQRALADRYGVAAFDVLDDLTVEAVLAAPAEAAVRVF